MTNYVAIPTLIVACGALTLLGLAVAVAVLHDALKETHETLKRHEGE